MKDLEYHVQATERALSYHLPGDRSTLSQALRYSIRGGKRLRGALVYATACDFGLASSKVDAAAAAIECIHAYSLVHDDLPAMDDDNLRRGQLATHKAYDEATAILVGDALNTLAFEILTRSLMSPHLILRQIALLSKAAGYHGMVAGQMLDMAHTHQACDLETLRIIHARKTGDLLRVALHLGAVVAGEDYERYRAELDAVGRALGIAYQISDDIFDGTRSAAELGKTPGKDQKQEKSTYPALLGLEASYREARRYFEEALSTCEKLPNGGENLAQIVEHLADKLEE